MEEIKKCAFAGDKSDEYCCNCNGIEMEMLNPETNLMEKISAKMCGGYQPTEIPTENIATQSTSTPELIQMIKEDVVTSEEEKSIVDEPRALGVVTEIQVSSSVSKEVRGQWFKVTYTETRQIPEGADIEIERRAIWDACNNEVDNQIKSIN